MRGRLILIFGALAALAAAAVVVAPLRRRAGSPATTDAARPNVLLISMDTTRADHLACYGHPRIKTPNIDRLAADGVLFEQCTTVAPLTLPAHASLMTGTYPFVHGARDNNQFHVHGKNATLAEAMREAGYATGAQVGTVVLARPYGLDQGFDAYVDVAPGDVGGVERRAADVCDGAVAWLRAHAAGPYFLFVHFYDPHQPFDPPAPFASQYDMPYLGEIAYVDEQIGRLASAAREAGGADRTLIVVTADHGESLREHGESTHGAFVYDCATRIPLIVNWPGHLRHGVRIGAQARLIDVAPTILDLAGLPALPAAQGVSLRTLLDGGPDLNLAAYSEAMHPFLNLGFSQLRALRVGGWKYIHAPRAELYHVGDDPGETINLTDAEPARAAAMREQLRALIASSPSVVPLEAAEREMSAAESGALATLGYAAGRKGSAWDAGTREIDLFDPLGDDPKDHRDEIERVNECTALVEQRNFDPAERLLRTLLAAAPGGKASFEIHMLLGKALAQTGRDSEAIEQFRAVLAARPDHPEALSELGVALGKLGRYDEAIGVLSRRLRVRPVLAACHLNLSIALNLQGRARAALTEADKAIEIDSNLPGAHAQRAVVLSRLGRNVDAIAAMRRAAELNPRNEEYAQQLRRMEQPPEGGG